MIDCGHLERIEECTILTGPKLSSIELKQTKRTNLYRLIESRRIECILNRIFRKNQNRKLAIKKCLSEGHYSDVYLIRSENERKQNQKKYRENFVIKIIDRNRCPKLSNCHNESRVCRFLQV